MSSSVSLSHVRVDTLGAWLSIGCAIHCMALPLLLGVAPLLGLGFLASDLSETLFLSASTGVAVLSLCWGFTIHRKCRAVLLLASGALLMVAGRSVINDFYEVPVVALGALSVAAAHLTNRHLCLSCRHCEDDRKTTQTGGQT
jgi:hypothetical protein